MPKTVGKLEWRIQAVGTGVLADALPIDLGTVTAKVNTDNAEVVARDDGFAERLGLALAAFRAVFEDGS